MRTIVFIVFFAFASPTLAGSLAIVYTNDAGVATYSPSATVSDADAAKIIAWCKDHYIAKAGSQTALGCFNIYTNEVFAKLKADVDGAAQKAASDAAAASAATIAVNPNQ